jgi:hypothetical protein
MGTKKAYRYDAEDYPKEKIIFSRGDHFDGLIPIEQQAETLIRQGRENGEQIRAKSLYAWERLDVAERLWRLKNGKPPLYLFELEIEDNDFVHRADLDAFTAVTTAIESKKSPDAAIRDYWDGVCRSDRIEVLVRKAKVLRRLKHCSDS